jgi:hypothetical protein
MKNGRRIGRPVFWDSATYSSGKPMLDDALGETFPLTEQDEMSEDACWRIRQQKAPIDAAQVRPLSNVRCGDHPFTLFSTMGKESGDKRLPSVLSSRISRKQPPGSSGHSNLSFQVPPGDDVRRTLLDSVLVSKNLPRVS